MHYTSNDLVLSSQSIYRFFRLYNETKEKEQSFFIGLVNYLRPYCGQREKLEEYI